MRREQLTDTSPFVSTHRFAASMLGAIRDLLAPVQDATWASGRPEHGHPAARVAAAVDA